LQSVLARCPDLRLASDRVSSNDNFNFRRLQALPVCFGSAVGGP